MRVVVWTKIDSHVFSCSRRVNARVRYIEGDITSAEMPTWLNNFESSPNVLSEEEKSSFLATLKGVSISSDAFFPFRDSIDHASKVGVEFVAQPGGSVADDEVIAACNEYKMSMAFTDLRLFHHWNPTAVELLPVRTEVRCPTSTIHRRHLSPQYFPAPHVMRPCWSLPSCNFLFVNKY